MWTYCSFTIHLIIYTTPNTIILIFQIEAEKYNRYTTGNCIVFNTNNLIYMRLKSSKMNSGMHRQLHNALFSNLIYMKLRNTKINISIYRQLHNALFWNLIYKRLNYKDELYRIQLYITLLIQTIWLISFNGHVLF